MWDGKEDERDFQRRGGTIISALGLRMQEVEEKEKVGEEAQRVTKETDRWRGLQY